MHRTHLDGNGKYIPGKGKAQESKLGTICELAKGSANVQSRGEDQQGAWLLQRHPRIFILEPVQDKRNETATGSETS